VVLLPAVADRQSAARQGHRLLRLPMSDHDTPSDPRQGSQDRTCDPSDHQEIKIELDGYILSKPSEPPKNPLHW